MLTLRKKGQLVLPKEICDRLGWHEGQPLEVEYVRADDHIVLRPLEVRRRMPS
jgi:AbrB family looped-hinge helix DNA binding protein